MYCFRVKIVEILAGKRLLVEIFRARNGKWPSNVYELPQLRRIFFFFLIEHDCWFSIVSFRTKKKKKKTRWIGQEISFIDIHIQFPVNLLTSFKHCPTFYKSHKKIEYLFDGANSVLGNYATPCKCLTWSGQILFH